MMFDTAAKITGEIDGKAIRATILATIIDDGESSPLETESVATQATQHRYTLSVPYGAWFVHSRQMPKRGFAVSVEGYAPMLVDSVENLGGMLIQIHCTAAGGMKARID